MAISFGDCIRCLEIYRRILIKLARNEAEKEDILESLENMKNFGCLSDFMYKKLKEDVEKDFYLTLPGTIESEILNACRK
jgi:glutaredoxin-related protein